MLEEYLEKALSLARSMCGPGGPMVGGMGTIHLHCDPYGSKWIAYADWSDNSRITSGDSDSPLDAVMELYDNLEAFIKERT